jgi:hypothetical protein
MRTFVLITTTLLCRSQAVVDRKLLGELWSDVVGRALDNKTFQELQRMHGGGESGWSYGDVETMVLQGLIKQGLVRKLTPR